MAISSRLGTFGERRIQSNPKWEDYHYSTICSQIPAYCLYCREEIRTFKKKLDDRICQYCFKEFQYPYLFLRHKKTKCWINGESMSRNIESTLSISKVNQSRVESTFEKNIVPICLLMA
jgi:hypothetical protein